MKNIVNEELRRLNYKCLPQTLKLYPYFDATRCGRSLIFEILLDQISLVINFKSLNHQVVKI